VAYSTPPDPRGDKTGGIVPAGMGIWQPGLPTSSHPILRSVPVMADGWTDGQRIAIANTPSQQYLPVQLSCVKTELFDIAYCKREHSA